MIIMTWKTWLKNYNFWWSIGLENQTSNTQTEKKMIWKLDWAGTKSIYSKCPKFVLEWITDAQ